MGGGLAATETKAMKGSSLVYEDPFGVVDQTGAPARALTQGM